MADDYEQFAKPVNSVERLGNKAKMPEVAISKREDSKASIEQVDFLKAPKENKGPSQLLPSISRTAKSLISCLYKVALTLVQSDFFLVL